MMQPPIPFPVSPINQLALDARIKRLEEALLASFELIDRLGECLKSHFGEDCLGHDWLGSMSRPAQDREVVDQLSALLKQGQASTAARVFREVTGVTWDEAHAAMKRWDEHSSEEKTRWLRLVRWMRTIHISDGKDVELSGPSE